MLAGMLLAGTVLLLFAALQVGEARLLTNRGVQVDVVAAGDGGGWFFVGNHRYHTSLTSDGTLVVDPNMPQMHAATPAAHAAKAWPLAAAGVTLLAAAAAAAAAADRQRRTTTPTPEVAWAQVRRDVTARQPVGHASGHAS